ncbi:MAG TPA: hypothetical protein PK843_14140 [bacterium]|nr:hypothetical protein [bacterium]HPN35651.1 hypothetical protein [bacterium]
MIALSRFGRLSILAAGFSTLACTSNKDFFTDQVLATIPARIPYSAEYKNHLQGMTTDYQRHLYWSHTTVLVKTDLKGAIIKSISVPDHHGDLAYHRGKLYVAVNLGQFNEKPGLADSWIYVYKAEDLRFVEKYPVPEVVHGAGGIAIHQDQFMVVGGLPGLAGYDKNFVYEYDRRFHLKKIHELESGPTRLGIQTAAWFNGFWYFGCYASEKHPDGVVLKAGMTAHGCLQLVDSYEMDMSFGLIGLEANRFLCSNRSLDHAAAILELKH